MPVLGLPGELGLAGPVAPQADLHVAPRESTCPASTSRRMTEPCESRAPKTSLPRVRVGVEVHEAHRSVHRPAHARTFGSVIEWSPPRITGMAPAASAWATVASMAACERTGSARAPPAASPKSTTRSSAKASTLASRCGPGGAARGPDRARREARARAGRTRARPSGRRSRRRRRRRARRDLERVGPAPPKVASPA